MTVNFIKIFRILYRLLIFMLLLSLLVAHNNTASSQGAHNWSPQQRVPGYADDTLPPYLVADQNRTVHAFTSQWVGEDNPQLAVVYNQWTLEGGWTPVVDIILSPMEQARVMGAFLDKDGIMHLIFFGGDDRFANIYYTRAPAVNAGRAKDWKEPRLIGSDAITPNTASIAGDKFGNLVVLYSGRINGNGIYSIYSTDSGSTWSEITPLYLTGSDELKPYGINTYLGKFSWLHAVWNVVDDIGHNRSGHYSRLNSETWEWAVPIEFDQGIGIDRGMGIAYPSVIEHDGKVIIMYNNGIPPEGVPPAQWFKYSRDYGITWTAPIRAFSEHVGRNGKLSFAIDSNRGLHVLFGQRIPIGNVDAIHGMWHSTLSGNIWTLPNEVVSGPPVLDRINNRGFDPYDAQATVSQGNVLLVTWRNDPGGVRNGVWFSYSLLNSPEEPVSHLQKSGVIELQATEPSPLLQAQDKYEVVSFPNENFSDSSNPQTAIFISLIPVAFIIVIAVFAQRKRILKN
jgi:hypothetical protein